MRLGKNYPTADKPLVFRDVIYNGQDAYDVKTGRFVCEVPGVYEFSFHCTIHGKSGNVNLLRNEELVLHSYTTKQSGYISASGSTLIELKKGDEVYLIAKLDGNGLSAHSYFSGHLVFVT